MGIVESVALWYRPSRESSPEHCAERVTRMLPADLLHDPAAADAGARFGNRLGRCLHRFESLTDPVEYLVERGPIGGETAQGRASRVGGRLILRDRTAPIE